MRGLRFLHNRLPEAPADNPFARGLLRDLDVCDPDRRRQTRWEAVLQNRRPKELFDEVDYRDGLWNQVSATQRQYLESERMGFGLTTLVESLRHPIPVDGAEAVWVHDKRLGAHSLPKLLVTVYLQDRQNAPLLKSRVMLSADAPPGTDVASLSPEDFDPVLLLHERWGFNYEASLYQATPRQLTLV